MTYNHPKNLQSVSLFIESHLSRTSWTILSLNWNRTVFRSTQRLERIQTCKLKSECPGWSLCFWKSYLCSFLSQRKKTKCFNVFKCLLCWNIFWLRRRNSAKNERKFSVLTGDTRTLFFYFFMKSDNSVTETAKASVPAKGEILLVSLDADESSEEIKVCRPTWVGTKLASECRVTIQTIAFHCCNVHLGSLRLKTSHQFSAHSFHPEFLVKSQCGVTFDVALPHRLAH